MRIQVTLPEQLVNKIDAIVKKGMYTSRSEYIRESIRDRFELDGEMTDDE